MKNKLLMLAVAALIAPSTAYGATPVDTLIGKYKKLALGAYTECLKEATRVMKSSDEAEFSVDDCVNRTMVIQKSEDEFDDSISITASVVAVDSYDAIHPIHFMVGCKNKNIRVTFFTKFPHHGLNDVVPLQYRIGKREAKNANIEALTGNEIVGFMLLGEQAGAFLEDVRSSNNEPLLVRIDAANTFKARFDVKNSAEVAADVLSVCPSLQ